MDKYRFHKLSTNIYHVTTKAYKCKVKGVSGFYYLLWFIKRHAELTLGASLCVKLSLNI